MAIYPVKHVSWDEVVEWSTRLAAKVKESGYKPDVVVAVGRGGYVVSRLLCDLLDVDRLVALPIRWREQFRRRGEGYLADLIRCFAKAKQVDLCIADVVKRLSIEVVFNFDINLEGYNVLAVEEISATGLHLAKAKEIALNNWRAGNVKTATLVWKASTSPLKPDYVFITTNSFVWFQFPWSRLSDYQQFAKVAMEEECRNSGKCQWTLDEVEKLFRKWYGFDADRKYLSMALEKLVELEVARKIGNAIYLILV